MAMELVKVSMKGRRAEWIKACRAESVCAKFESKDAARGPEFESKDAAVGSGREVSIKGCRRGVTSRPWCSRYPRHSYAR
jgi:hypothetical protein